jgi:hypothetical protein
MPQTLSPGFKKLLREPAYCQLATLMPDGSPQNTQVWSRPTASTSWLTPPRVDRRSRTSAAIRAWRSTWWTRLIDELAKKYLDEDTYGFRQPGEVRLTIKIAPEKINELGLEEAA